MRQRRPSRLTRRNTILGFAANRRFGSVAFVEDDGPDLRNRRLPQTTSGWTEMAITIEVWLVRACPRVVVLVVDDEGETKRGVEVCFEDRVREVAGRHGVPLIELRRAEVASRLGLVSGTNAEFCRAMAKAVPSIGARLGGRRYGQRSDRDRHHEMSVVAFAGTRAAAGLLAEIDRARSPNGRS